MTVPTGRREDRERLLGGFDANRAPAYRPPVGSVKAGGLQSVQKAPPSDGLRGSVGRIEG